MALDVEKVITDKAEQTRKTFRALLDKTNKEHPNPKDLIYKEEGLNLRSKRPASQQDRGTPSAATAADWTTSVLEHGFRQ